MSGPEIVYLAALAVCAVTAIGFFVVGNVERRRWRATERALDETHRRKMNELENQ